MTISGKANRLHSRHINLIAQLFSLLWQIYSVAIWRVLLALMWSQFAAEVIRSGYLAHSDNENLWRPISWFTFCAREDSNLQPERYKRGASTPSTRPSASIRLDGDALATCGEGTVRQTNDSLAACRQNTSGAAK
jgi:hypothetical protein